MFFICGSRWKTKPLGQLDYRCSKCGKTVVHTANVVTGKFTCFFVPCCTLRKRYTIVCNLCGLRSKAEGNLLTQLKNWESTGQLSSTASVAGGRLCPKCGAGMPADASFCRECGTRL